ncbi:NACHT, LRR and PYD domains-containing protein 12-like [Astyanax mexicanus]|uniref:NACHT, LRR and PYD domains-containing protein 12-like n=1 Tax=Astyanax mexicanus TaxID=7994 RepID=UPI0020CB5978|nr:NACHT, LRR and PYD domains-containing protein 12-like [Astyanax mexicanus]
MADFLKSAVDRALQSKSGRLDLFLRFLLGLSLECNLTLLQSILKPTEKISYNNEETVRYIKEKIKENTSPEKSINLFHCLNELNDHSLVQEVQRYINRGGDHRLRHARLSPAQWSALLFVLQNSEQELDEFDLSKYDPSEECFLMLLSVVKASRRAVLASCHLGVKTCEELASIFNLENSSLKELDISNNDLQDLGVEQLSAGLKSSHCKLQILRLSGCMVTEEGCSSLDSALSSNPSYLKELDLNYNHPGTSGVKLLLDRLHNPQSKLETLGIKHGGKSRIKPGLKKYCCDLTLDQNTAHTHLSLSQGNRRVECGEYQPYPDHPERFDVYQQVMSRENLLLGG